MSAELATVNKIKQNTDMYCIDNELFDDTKMLDVSGIFPATDLSTRKIVLDLPSSREFGNKAPFKITPSDGESGSFGISVSISDTNIAVGSYGNGPGGAVYLYNLDGTNEVKITAPSGGQQFGKSVKLLGNKLLVGAPYSNVSSGKAYLYDITNLGSNIMMQSNMPNPGLRFGDSVSMSATKIVIGAPQENSSDGAAYIFDINGNLEGKIIGEDSGVNASFGFAVAINDTNIYVGAYTRDKVYAYDYNRTKIVDVTGHRTSGFSIDANNNKVIVGGPYYTNTVASAGHASIVDIGLQSGLVMLEPSDPAVAGDFGQTVRLNDTQVAISAKGNSEVYLYNLDGTNEIKIKAPFPDSASIDFFGFGLDISNDILALPSYWNNEVYIYKKASK